MVLQGRQSPSGHGSSSVLVKPVTGFSPAYQRFQCLFVGTFCVFEHRGAMADGPDGAVAGGKGFDQGLCWTICLRQIPRGLWPCLGRDRIEPVSDTGSYSTLAVGQFLFGRHIRSRHA